MTERIPCTAGEAIQALCNAFPRTSLSVAPPRRTHNSCWPLSMWVASSQDNYMRLLVQFLGDAERGQLDPSDRRELEWLAAHTPDQDTLDKLIDEAQYYSNTGHGEIQAARRRAVENAASLRHWLERGPTPYDHTVHLQYQRGIEAGRQRSLDRRAEQRFKKAQRAAARRVRIGSRI